MKKSQNMRTKNIFMPFFFLFYCKVDLCKNYLLADRVVEEVNYKLKTKKTKKNCYMQYALGPNLVPLLCQRIQIAWPLHIL